MKSLGLMFAQNNVSDGGMCHINTKLSDGQNKCQSNCTYLNQQELGRSIWGVTGECFAFFLNSLIQWVLVKEKHH